MILYYLKKHNLDGATMVKLQRYFLVLQIVVYSPFQVVKLYGLVHPESKIALIEEECSLEAKVRSLREYIQSESKQETKLQITLDSLLETQKLNKVAQ